MNLKITSENIYFNNVRVGYLSDGGVYILADNGPVCVGLIDHPREIEPLIREWMRSKKLAVLPEVMKRLHRVSPLSDNE